MHDTAHRGRMKTALCLPTRETEEHAELPPSPRERRNDVYDPGAGHSQKKLKKSLSPETQVVDPMTALNLDDTKAERGEVSTSLF
jgi:hypothetical protein